MDAPQTPPDGDRWAGHRWFAVAVTLVLAAGCAWSAARLARMQIDPSEWQPDHWVDGRAGNQLNRALGTLPGQGRIDLWSAALRYRLLGDLGPQVREGCPDWLFYRDGLQPQPGQGDAFSQRLKLMRHWTGRLGQSGIHTVVAVVPDKSRIESAHLCGLEVSRPLQARLDAWQQALAAGGVPFADLRPALSSLPQAFYRTDVHMAPRGAEAAAARAAEVALPLLGGPGGQVFEAQRGTAPEPRMGDLIVLAGLEHAPDGWRPPLERVVPEHVRPVHAGGLLDEGPQAEVLLLGDSNGLRSDFAERLGRRLGREVWNQSQDGGYFSGAMLSALARQERWPASLRLVVWQFSELSLSLPLSAEERRALAALP
ncbi:alginate O-acetyltransferase AlgX-related protein [Acidovorax sacchari]|uniref:alginate O-acetyltransferase AlgX-related protein n=1 Tax=Acidovorax sacchari TaxID=3230736 RepID=UPI0039E5ECCD